MPKHPRLLPRSVARSINSTLLRTASSATAGGDRASRVETKPKHPRLLPRSIARFINTTTLRTASSTSTGEIEQAESSPSPSTPPPASSLHCSVHQHHVSQKKTDQEKALEVYYAFITVGITTFLWKDAIQMLDRVNTNNENLTPFAAIYFAFAIISMVLGMVACKFPESAPLSMGTAGHGAFHALLFMVLGLHLDTFVYHVSYRWAICCVSVTGFLFTIYWGCSVKDHVIIQACVKFLWWIASWSRSKLQQVPDRVCSLWKRLVSKLRSYRVPPPENEIDGLYEEVAGSPRDV